MAHNTNVPLTLLFIFITLASAKIFASARRIIIVNVCKETVWPGIFAWGDYDGGEGFALKPGLSNFYNASDKWSGRIWARTGCSFSNSTSSCQTGGCGPSINCTGPGSKPVTIAEFTLSPDIDFYDVSLVDGFNVPILIQPLSGKGNCSRAGCDGDLRQSCSDDLAVKDTGKVIGCRSACDKFNTDDYCCRGMYGELGSCSPSNYSRSFKKVCPAASSYAFDSNSSVITCSGTDYVVAFCATRNQTVCSYQANKLSCNQPNGVKAFSQNRWLLLMLVLPITLNLQAIL
ncbi:pathogenesis-related thaumatin-like protein 3.5 isoform X2 [Mangifera indica]|uniref:pathogenesis-related thaumatin-like protein 3.5 isoform X2 n=1 Tax=Mangifera indica TaxID=29780 RepID=UPI001CF953DD|nr:pathogenesis-related thaumatin-like protein 3.5 isoform X2 [Mangifera indica]